MCNLRDGIHPYVEADGNFYEYVPLTSSQIQLLLWFCQFLYNNNEYDLDSFQSHLLSMLFSYFIIVLLFLLCISDQWVFLHDFCWYFFTFTFYFFLWVKTKRTKRWKQHFSNLDPDSYQSKQTTCLFVFLNPFWFLCFSLDSSCFLPQWKKTSIPIQFNPNQLIFIYYIFSYDFVVTLTLPTVFVLMKRENRLFMFPPQNSNHYCIYKIMEKYIISSPWNYVMVNNNNTNFRRNEINHLLPFIVCGGKGPNMCIVKMFTVLFI